MNGYLIPQKKKSNKNFTNSFKRQTNLPLSEIPLTTNKHAPLVHHSDAHSLYAIRNIALDPVQQSIRPNSMFRSTTVMSSYLRSSRAAIARNSRLSVWLCTCRSVRLFPKPIRGDRWGSLLWEVDFSRMSSGTFSCEFHERISTMLGRPVALRTVHNHETYSAGIVGGESLEKNNNKMFNCNL